MKEYSKDPATCIHGIKVEAHWEANPLYDWRMDDDDYVEEASNWVPAHTKDTSVDIDTHRYKCTQCGKIMYYSGAARSYYEDGTKSGIRGLE